MKVWMISDSIDHKRIYGIYLSPQTAINAITPLIKHHIVMDFTRVPNSQTYICRVKESDGHQKYLILREIEANVTHYLPIPGLLKGEKP